MLHVRQLGISDAGAIEQHLLALAPLDRWARFFGKLTDEAISAYARRLDPSIHPSSCMILISSE